MVRYTRFRSDLYIYAVASPALLTPHVVSEHQAFALAAATTTPTSAAAAAADDAKTKVETLVTLTRPPFRARSSHAHVQGRHYGHRRVGRWGRRRGEPGAEGRGRSGYRGRGRLFPTGGAGVGRHDSLAAAPESPAQ